MFWLHSMWNINQECVLQKVIVVNMSMNVWLNIIVQDVSVFGFGIRSVASEVRQLLALACYNFFPVVFVGATSHLSQQLLKSNVLQPVTLLTSVLQVWKGRAHGQHPIVSSEPEPCMLGLAFLSKLRLINKAEEMPFKGSDPWSNHAMSAYKMW